MSWYKSITVEQLDKLIEFAKLKGATRINFTDNYSSIYFEIMNDNNENIYHNGIPLVVNCELSDRRRVSYEERKKVDL